MRRTAVVPCVLLLVLAAFWSPSAQSKPNFAGKWTLVVDSSVDPTALGELGRNPVVTQDEKTITVVTMQPAGELRTVYNLDGSESNNPIKFGETSFDRLSKIKWDGTKLVINTKVIVLIQVIDTTMTWSLSATGELVVDAVTNAQGKQITSKRTYKKN